jgi:predicted transcriptional regulator with HTH domain
MSKVSDEKREKLKEEILRIIYENYPAFLYTYQIAENMIRDDEFVLNLLNELKNKNLIRCLEETSGGNIKRKWGLKKEIYEKYKELSG